jgi:hypothetical protein
LFKTFKLFTYVNRFAVVLLLALFAMGPVYGQGPMCAEVFSQAWFDRIVFPEIEKKLLSDRIVKIEDMSAFLESSNKKPSGISGAYLVTFEDGMRGVWKPKSYIGEVLAYHAARFVGNKFVPPTVYRKMRPDQVDTGKIPPEVWNEINGREGSLQFFVKTTVDLLGDWKIRNEAWSRVPGWQKDERDAFNFVFGHWDRHWGNVLVDDTSSVVMIDNSSITTRQKVQFGSLPFLKRYILKEDQKDRYNQEKFPFASAETYNNQTSEALFSRIKTLLGEKSFENMMKDLHTESDNKKVLKKDISLAIVPWKGNLWVQYIGFRNYGPLTPKNLRPEVVEKYKALNFENLRALFPNDSSNSFPDSYIGEILERRDQLLQNLKSL